jgi:hypothetical protein
MVMLFSKYVPPLLSALTPHPPPRFSSSELHQRCPAQEVVSRKQIPQLIQHAHSQTAKAWSWIASSRSLSSGAHSRDPLAPCNDEKYGSILLIAFPVSLKRRLAARHECPLPDL